MQIAIGLRMQRVRFLLENTDWRLNEIAVQVGYKDGLTLSKMFKGKTGSAQQHFGLLWLVLNQTDKHELLSTAPHAARA